MICYHCAWVVFRRHNAAARKHRLAELMRIMSRTISRRGSYPRGVIPGQLRGSSALWVEATAGPIHEHDLREPARVRDDDKVGT